MTATAHAETHDKPANSAWPSPTFCLMVFASAFSHAGMVAGQPPALDAPAAHPAPSAVTQATSEAAAQPVPCGGKHFREFDFWIGEWQVEAKGEVIADSSITRAQNGCVVHERYQLRGASYQGQSLNIYDASRAVWHQTWVDNSGMLLTLEGTWWNGAMVLEGQRRVRDVDVQITQWERITWTPSPDGSVRQHWQSRREGQEWQTAFDGVYRKTSKP